MYKILYILRLSLSGEKGFEFKIKIMSSIIMLKLYMSRTFLFKFYFFRYGQSDRTMHAIHMEQIYSYIIV